MITTDEPDQIDAMEDVGERIADALERLTLAAPAVNVAPPTVQVAAPVVRVTMPAAQGWTFTVTSRDAEGRIQSLTARPLS